jgi:hypothetical protein
MTHTDYANGLRQVADFLESHPEIKLPDAQLSCYAIFNKDEAAAVLHAFGNAKKEYDDNIFLLSKDFGAINLRYVGQRSAVCEKVQVGTKEVPEYVEPAVEAQPERVVPAHEEPIIEWRCGSILAPEDENANESL